MSNMLAARYGLPSMAQIIDSMGERAGAFLSSFVYFLPYTLLLLAIGFVIHERRTRTNEILVVLAELAENDILDQGVYELRLQSRLDEMDLKQRFWHGSLSGHVNRLNTFFGYVIIINPADEAGYRRLKLTDKGVAQALLHSSK